MLQPFRNNADAIDAVSQARKMFAHSPINFHRCLAYPLVLLLSASLFQGCTISRTFFATADCDYKRVKLQKWSEDSAKEAGTIRVLLVHGMNNYPFGFASGKPILDGCANYGALQQKLSGDLTFDDRARLRSQAVESQFKDFVTKLASKLEAGPENQADANDFVIVHAPNNSAALGYVFTRSFGASGPGHRALKFYIANWALAASVVKEQQFGGWDNSQSNTANLKGDRDFDPELDKHRAPLNRSLKRGTIDWGLGDAALYLSAEGEKLRQVVREGIKRLQTETGPRDRIAIVSASLGSTIALDTVPALFRSGGARSLFTKADKMADSPKQARAVFYMFANQFALLTAGRPRSEQVNPLIKLNNALEEAEAQATVQVYAFTDPNDLLSLPLNTKLDKVSICNVYVRNPGLTLGVAMNPGDAHVNYERNNHVIATLLNGPEKTPIKPSDCP